MAYDRFDPRFDRENSRHDRERSSQGRGWSDDDGRRWRGGGGGRDEDRGWFERAGEQLASWFGDDDDRRGERRPDRDERGGRREPMGGRGRQPWSSHEDHMSRHEPWGGGQFERGHDRERHDRERGYRPMTGDYGGSQGMMDRGGFDDRQRQQGWDGPQHQQQHHMHDPHYHNMRQRHVEDLDRDYDEYRRENQSRFESEFSSWREQRMQKRAMLGTVAEHMQVVGNDDQPVGTVDRIARDRIILTKSDPQAGGAHHSIGCAMIDRIDNDRVILSCSADEARQSWRKEEQNRSMSEGGSHGEDGPHILNRSFEGTYR